MARGAILIGNEGPPVGVASRHDHRRKMLLPQKKITSVEGNDMRDHYYPSAFSLTT
jgi:hypothetical protein